ncbi:MAG: hypothetical protein ACE5IZ_11260 [Dehalococcoidia bacterium]
MRLLPLGTVLLAAAIIAAGGWLEALVGNLRDVLPRVEDGE